MIQGLKQLDGIAFAARIMIEPASNPQYKDANKLANVVLPGEPQYAADHARRDRRAGSGQRQAAQGGGDPGTAAPAWGAPTPPAAPTSVPWAEPSAPPPARPAGPDWLNT